LDIFNIVNMKLNTLLAFMNILLGCCARILSKATYLTATALVTNAQNHSALECWEFTSPLNTSSSAGTSGAATFNFVNVEEAEYTVIPPRFDGGTHNAPAPQ